MRFRAEQDIAVWSGRTGRTIRLHANSPHETDDPDEIRVLRASPHAQVDPTRDELLDRARASGVPGRSKMTKDDLAEAVGAETGDTNE